MNRDLPSSTNGHNAPQEVGIDLKSNDPLLEAYDALDAAWRQAEEDFAAMQVPVTVSHEVSNLVDPEHSCGGRETFWLEWTRYHHQWRICYVRRIQHWHGTSWDERRKPIVECPIEMRVKIASELRPLREKMEEARRKYHSCVTEAIEAIKEALAD